MGSGTVAQQIDAKPNVTLSPAPSRGHRSSKRSARNTGSFGVAVVVLVMMGQCDSDRT